MFGVPGEYGNRRRVVHFCVQVQVQVCIRVYLWLDAETEWKLKHDVFGVGEEWNLEIGVWSEGEERTKMRHRRSSCITV